MPQDPSRMNKDASTREPADQRLNPKPTGKSGGADANARTRPDQADNPSSGKVKAEGRSNTTKSPNVHDNNVDRA